MNGMNEEEHFLYIICIGIYGIDLDACCIEVEKTTKNQRKINVWVLHKLQIISI